MLVYIHFCVYVFSIFKKIILFSDWQAEKSRFKIFPLFCFCIIPVFYSLSAQDYNYLLVVYAF